VGVSVSTSADVDDASRPASVRASPMDGSLSLINNAITASTTTANGTTIITPGKATPDSNGS
jgi:hypothetical protein